MKLRELIPEADIEAATRQIVETLLDQEVKVIIDGEAIGTFIHQEWKCDICGQENFATSQALAGHKYHKHGITKDTPTT